MTNAGTPKDLAGAIANGLNEYTGGSTYSKDSALVLILLSHVKDKLAQDLTISMINPPNDDAAKSLSALWNRITEGR